MSRKSLVAALALVLALAVAVPTMAQEQSQVGLLAKAGFAKKTAKRAKQIAKEARSLARAVDRKATSAKNRADRANAAAQAATTTATGVEQQLNDQRATTATLGGTVETSDDTDYVALGGPEVTVKVPQSGLIEVWAQVTIAPEGAVSLYEDGQQMDGQSPNDFCDAPPGALLAQSLGESLTLATPTGAPLLFCGSEGAPAPVLFTTSPGNHTYELRYADCGCDADPAEFSDRTLTVAPRP
jgi:hypothetical protein